MCGSGFVPPHLWPTTQKQMCDSLKDFLASNGMHFKDSFNKHAKPTGLKKIFSMKCYFKRGREKDFKSKSYEYFTILFYLNFHLN